ncbi:MAG: peptidoglycan DD-metalloendopeptidase family protein [Elusimicrobia bacterium]|nr:peptidoglycan DD-metalloendopeptidase family protein [Candidatus Obscuribacterium magneticum]
MIISTGTVRLGDTLSVILTNQGLTGRLVADIQRAFAKAYNLRLLKPGHTFEVVTSTAGAFKKFVYHTGPVETYSVSVSSEGLFSSRIEKENIVWRKRVISGEIKEFLYKDLLTQGYDEPFVATLTSELGDNILAWRVDFFTEQRVGDKYKILLESESLMESTAPVRGAPLRILAAYYQGSGTRRKENYAVRYRLPGSNRPDYFDKEGQAVRKAFLRAPFKYAAFRISSGFSFSRLHPILRSYRPHHGTDYAAGTGTPVVAIGNGTVRFSGWKGGYGKCVDVRHNNTYTSRYGHLSRVMVREGDHVSQGQYIGNVGSSGLSTGPHLHFEMLVNGSQKNFLRMDFPSASSVPNKFMGDFSKVRDRLLADLEAGEAGLTNASASPEAEN